MSNKTKFNVVTRVDWTNWIKEGISNKIIKYYEYNSFSSVKEIGFRNSRKVYRANWKSSRNPLALKTINEDTAEKIIYWLKLQREKHFYDNIIKFYGVTIDYRYDSSRKYMLVMEYADSGTLRRYLKENFSSLTWNDKSVIAYQLAYAVSCLHDENIIHGDLHSDNVLVHQNTIKLADFGVNPERFYSDEYSLIKGDIYNVGLLLWEISSGRPPFNGENSYRRPIPNTPKDYVTIYTDCWKEDPPTIYDIVARLEAIMERNFETSNDYQLYDFNREVQNSNSSFVEDLYSCNSDEDIQKYISSLERTEKDFHLQNSNIQQSSFEKTTKDFRSYDSKSNIQKPISSFAKDFYSCNSDIDISSLGRTEDFQLHDSNSSFKQLGSERTTKDFRSCDSNSNSLSSFAKDFYTCNSKISTQQCFSSLDKVAEDSYSYNSDADIQQPSFVRTTTKDFRPYNSNSNVQKPISSFTKDSYSYNSDVDIQQPSFVRTTTKDFRPYNSNSNVQKPISSFTKDSYSYNSDVDIQQPSFVRTTTKDFRPYNSNSNVQKPISSFTKDSYSYNSDVDIQQPSFVRTTTKDFRPYNSNSNVQKPISSFAKDFYSYSSDTDIQQCISSFERDFQLHDSNSNYENNNSYNSNVNNQQSISGSSRINSLPYDSDIEDLIGSINNDTSSSRNNNNKSPSDFWKYLK
ncbi:Ste7p [Rhizophagus irregularis DAOM 197198w]|uniref:Ste7p n=1 Tax=Rhizophagus irregularis (strain DAOM 197198w) TaxID=1432141 RepID=A0A015J6E5_RHIIW|nr:Ste7p [Rhizophagus irregularis DAOM 197198w]